MEEKDYSMEVIITKSTPPNVTNNEGSSRNTSPSSMEEDTPTVRVPLFISTPDDDTIDEKDLTFSYPVAGPYAMGDKLYSDTVLVGGIPLCIMLYPVGNKEGLNMGMYVSVGTSEVTPPRNWDAYLHFKFAILSSVPGENVEKLTNKILSDTSKSWGFPQFLELEDINDPAKGFIVDGKISVCVTVRAVAGKSTVWGYYSKYSSKDATGMVGLNNQGATCYMNSVLQTLFATNALRRAVFRMPTEHDDAATSVALALQRVFFRLQTASEAVETAELTKSFGWTSMDSFMQHDIQEFARVLMDNIEEKMKGTPVAGFVAGLLAGTTKSCIRCSHVDYESSREETFYDLQLDIKGVDNIVDAFRRYVASEVMDGDNKYQAEGHGLQEAKKSTIFRKLPPVLHLHLKRFEYSIVREDYVKINDRVEFPETLDLTEFLETPGASRAVYVLHSVLVHSGGAQGGHYTVYIRPDPAKAWYKFDDDNVTLVSKEAAIDKNFGSSDRMSAYRYGSNAYMLVYVAQAQAADLLRPCELDDIPQHLRDRFEEEERAVRQQEQDRLEAASYVNIQIVTEDFLRTRTRINLLDPTEMAGVTTLKLRRTDGVATLMEAIAARLDVPVVHQRLHPISRKLPTWYLREPLQPDSLHDLGTLSTYARAPCWRLFLQDTRIGEGEFNYSEHQLVFLKQFDAATQTISYVGHAVRTESDTLESLLTDFPAGTRIFCDCPEDPAELSPAAVMTELKNGASIMLQPPTPPGLPEPVPFCEYVIDLANKIDMTLLALPGTETDPPAAPLTLTLRKNMTHAQVAQALARSLGIQAWENLQFSSHDTTFDTPGNVVRYSADITLDEMRCYYSRASTKMYYELLSLSVEELTHKLRIKPLLWFDYATHATTSMDLIVDRLATVGDVLEQVRGLVSPPPTRPLRMVELFSHSQFRRIPSATELMSAVLFPYNVTVRVEEVPADQLDLDLEPEPAEDSDRTRLLAVVEHISKDVYSKHGQPFLFVLVEDELVSGLRRRLAAALNIPMATIEKWRLGYITGSCFTAFDDDSAVRLDDLYNGNRAPRVALDHPDKTPKRSRWTEKALKIYN